MMWKIDFCMGAVLLLTGCNSKPVSNEVKAATENIDSSAKNEVHLLKDSVFDLSKYEAYFLYKNDLSKIPFEDEEPLHFGEKVSAHLAAIDILDSNSVKIIYQDSVRHYYPSDQGYGGNRFYGYLDTFKNFNVVCMYTGRGDGGDTYDLVTFTKAGKRIACLEDVAWKQGEEDEWQSQQTARIVGREIEVEATTCHAVDSIKLACDALRQFYKFEDNGQITFIKRDSVLSPALDSIRKAIPYN